MINWLIINIKICVLYIFLSLFLFFFVLFLSKEYKQVEFIEHNSIRGPLDLVSTFKKGNSSEILEGMVLEKYPPVKIVRTSSDSCFFEFDKTWFGTVEFKITDSTLPERMVVRLGELAEANHVFKPSSLKYENVAYHESTIELNNINAKSVRVKIPSRVLPNDKLLPFGLTGVLPFRYLEVISGCTKHIEDNAFQLALSYPFNGNNSKFESDNVILNEVYELAKHTIKATSYVGLYIDGYREIKPYEADAYINQLGHYAIDSDYLLARRTQEYLLSNGTWPTEWTMHSIFMAYQDYLQTGDKVFLRNNYEKLKARTLMDLANENLLISSSNQTSELLVRAGVKAVTLIDLIDWPIDEQDNYVKLPIDIGNYIWKSAVIFFKEIRFWLVQLAGFEKASNLYALDITNLKNKLKKFPSVNTVVNAFHYASLTKMEYIAFELEEFDDANFFKERSEALKTVIQNVFFNRDKELFVDAPGASHASKQANVFGLAFGLVPPESLDSVLDFVVQNKTGSVYLYQYVLEALFENGRSDQALDILTSTGDRSWYHMIHSIGSSLTVESWNFDVNPGMDLNHSWATAPVNMIPRYLAGIRPVAPRFSRFIVSPSDSSVNFYNIVVPTLEGNINLRMQRNDGAVTYKLEFTGSKVADIHLLKPNCHKVNATVNNKEVVAPQSNASASRVALLGVTAGKYAIKLECK